MEVNNVKLHTCSIGAINSNKSAKGNIALWASTHLIRGRGHSVELLVFLIPWWVKTSAQSGVHLSSPPFSGYEACISFLSSHHRLARRGNTGYILSSSFFISPIQLPLNLDQIACSGRFSSPHLAKKTQQEENTLCVWKVSSLLMILRKSTLALSFSANTGSQF